jgi:transcriptional regulator NrdR family protein
MVCVYCDGKTKITNSRPQKRLGQTWRRHACTVCGAIFTTIEAPDLSGSLRFVARDGTLSPFERDVLFMSVAQALGHRRDAIEAAGALTATITAKLLKAAQSSRITRTELVSMVATILARFDKASAVQYRAYHTD